MHKDQRKLMVLGVKTVLVGTIVEVSLYIIYENATYSYLSDSCS